MRSAAYAVFVLTLGLALAGCKSEAEKEMSNAMAKQKDMVSALKGVTDKDSAKAANVKLKAIAKDMSDMFDRMKQVRASQDEQKRVVEKYKPEQEQIQKDLQAETQRISAHPEWVMEMMEGLQEIGRAGMKAQMMAK
jgi:predicted  nucleic acid-binding Zn-ribbon protein